MLTHLPVGEFHGNLRDQLLDMRSDLRNILHPVVDIIYLAVSCTFPLDRFPHHLVIIFHHIGLDRHTVIRRFFKDAHIPDPDKAHMECPRNRRCRQRQHIYVLLKLLDLLLMLNAEPLLLIDDQKAQILELDVIPKHPVSPDHNIDQTPFHILHRLLLLRRSPETAHQVHPDREILHPLQERIVMLLCKDRCRHQIYYLLILLYGFERRTDRDLCLAVPHIPADQAVHDLTTLHIPLDRLDSKKLILRLLERKHLLEFLLPDGILSVHIPLLILPCSIQLHQIPGDLPYGAPHLCLRPVPLLGT